VPHEDAHAGAARHAAPAIPPATRGPRPAMPPPAEAAAARAPAAVGQSAHAGAHRRRRVVLVLAIGSYFVFRSKPEPSPAPRPAQRRLRCGPAEAAARQPGPVGAKPARGQGFPRGGQAGAGVLDKDASHARPPRCWHSAQKAMEEVEAAVAETRKAMDTGNVKGASEGLSRILALDPRTPRWPSSSRASTNSSARRPSRRARR
jgi:hypothetical protein